VERFCVGVDVSAKKFDVAVRVGKGRVDSQTFANDSAGHRAFVKYMKKRWKSIRVVMESTGIYGLDLAMRAA
jgi:transposase